MKERRKLAKRNAKLKTYDENFQLVAHSVALSPSGACTSFSSLARLLFRFFFAVSRSFSHRRREGKEKASRRRGKETKCQHFEQCFFHSSHIFKVTTPFLFDWNVSNSLHGSAYIYIYIVLFFIKRLNCECSINCHGCCVLNLIFKSMQVIRCGTVLVCIDNWKFVRYWREQKKRKEKRNVNLFASKYFIGNKKKGKRTKKVKKDKQHKQTHTQ